MSKTSRSIRGRYVALAAVTAGVSWLSTGQAMAGDGTALAAACEPKSQDTMAGLSNLAPATGVLSITDAAGAAAGQGLPSLPGRPGAASAGRVLPGTMGLPGKAGVPAAPAVPGPKSIPGPMAIPAAPKAAQAVPAVAGAPANAVPAGVPAAPKAIPAGVPAAPRAFLPTARMPMVPLLALAPARPSLRNPACVPAAPVVTGPVRGQARPKARVHPISQAPKRHGHPKPEAQQPAAGQPQAQAGAHGQAQPGVQAPGQPPAHVRGHGHRQAHPHPGANGEPFLPAHPHHKQHGTHGEQGQQGQQENGTAGQALTPGRHHGHHHGDRHANAPAHAGAAAQPVPPVELHPNTHAGSGAAGAAGEPKTPVHHKRHRHHHLPPASAALQTPAPTAQPAPPESGKHGAHRDGREHPKAAAEPQSSTLSKPPDLTTPALAKATGTGAVNDIADAAGKKLLP